MASWKGSAAMVALIVAATLSAPAGAKSYRNLNPTLNSVNQPVVEQTDYLFDLAAGPSGVPDSELSRLAHWFETLRLRYGDRIFTDSGSDGRNPRAEQQIAGVAAEFGLLLSEGAPVTTGQVQPGTVRVVLSRSVASVPGCPNWSEAGEIGNRITTGSNYGCAVNSNLAAMIADPNDLVLGQTSDGSGDPVSTTKAIKHYRDTAPTGGTLQATSAKGDN